MAAGDESARAARLAAIHAAKAEQLLAGAEEMSARHDPTIAMTMAVRAQAHGTLAVFYVLAGPSQPAQT
jgi:hypothetical protein